MSEKTPQSTFLVERSNGEIVPMTSVVNYKDTNGVPVRSDLQRPENGSIAEKSVSSMQLRDGYQHHLAETLAKASPTYEARMSAKFTPEQLKLLGVKVGEEAVKLAATESSAPVVENVGDEERQAAARAAADNKYNEVMQATGSHEKAQAAADRVWRGFGFR